MANIVEAATLLAASTPYYYRLPMTTVTTVPGQPMSIMIQWHDATSAFAATLYTSNLDDPDVPAVAAAGPDVEQWHSEATDVPIPSVTASAAGCDMIHMGNFGAKWGLLKIEPSANTSLTIITHGKE